MVVTPCFNSFDCLDLGTPPTTFPCRLADYTPTAWGCQRVTLPPLGMVGVSTFLLSCISHTLPMRGCWGGGMFIYI
jgi:hypothetical protein